ncbi:MAG: endolytic transglycosylase MltG [Acidimicrobiales bacterium]|nr:endolytic transglycosylase MltG [Acidimicrobiales bacterium]|tara:strand:+ start:610 stop:1794 length:1185 start_codon:yes stop_codon:yes gene_type:complete
MNSPADSSFRGFRPPPPRQRRTERAKPSQREGVDYETVFVRKGRGTTLSILFLLGLLLIAAWVTLRAVQWGREQLDPPGEQGAAINLTLPPGVSTSGISKILEQNGVIPDARAYEWYVRLKGAPLFQAGDYTFHTNSAVWDALEILKTGPRYVEQNVRIRLTIPEGLTVRQIIGVIDQVEDAPFSGAEFEDEMRMQHVVSNYAPSPAAMPVGAIEPYEGLLFPDTYYLGPDSTPEELLTQMLNRFDQVLTGLGYAAAPQTVGLTPYETVVLASLIEREARVGNERAKISRVIHNRLAADWYLGIDASIIYVTGDNQLTASDLQTESPFNTRLSKGLPPTPIAAPGKAALEAAMAPVSGQWMFYVLADSEGRHNFSVSSDEFERDKAKCQERGLC